MFNCFTLVSKRNQHIVEVFDMEVFAQGGISKGAHIHQMDTNLNTLDFILYCNWLEEPWRTVTISIKMRNK